MLRENKKVTENYYYIVIARTARREADGNVGVQLHRNISVCLCLGSALWKNTWHHTILVLLNFLNTS